MRFFFYCSLMQMKYLWSDESQLSVTGLSGHNKSAAEIYASLVSSISVNVRDAGP